MVHSTPDQRLLTETGEPIKIWLDPTLPSLADLTARIKIHGAAISTAHDDPHTFILVLNPSSIDIFDQYCHPAWLPLSGRMRHQRLIKAGHDEAWRRKVIVDARWPRLLGSGRAWAGDNWGGCRKGGPPPDPDTIDSEPAPPQPAIRARPTSPIAPLSPAPQDGTSAPPPRARAPKSADKPTRWQNSGQDPPRILGGLTFYVAKGRLGRKHTIAYIRASGGKVVAHMYNATHALLCQGTATADKERQEAKAYEVWCLDFEWVERTWEEGQIQKEVDHALEEGIPRRLLGPLPEALSSWLTPEVLHPIFVEMHKKRLEGRHPSSLCSDLSAEYDGVYETSTWERLYELWQNDLGCFGSSPTEVPTNPTQDLEKTLREAHLSSFVTATTPLDVPKHLSTTNPLYSEQVWAAMYSNWLKSAPPFLPKKGDLEYKEYATVFATYFPLAKQGVSLSDIAQVIASEHPELGKTAADFHVHFGNWLRAGDLPQSTTPPGESQQGTTIAKKAPIRTSRNELAKLFKAEFDNASSDPRAVAETLALRTGFSANALAQYYKQFRAHAGVFANIRAELQYSGPSIIPEDGVPVLGPKRANEEGQQPAKRQKVG